MSREIMRVDGKYLSDINILNSSDNVQHDLRQVNDNHTRGKIIYAKKSVRLLLNRTLERSHEG